MPRLFNMGSHFINPTLRKRQPVCKLLQAPTPTHQSYREQEGKSKRGEMYTSLTGRGFSQVCKCGLHSHWQTGYTAAVRGCRLFCSAQRQPDTSTRSPGVTSIHRENLWSTKLWKPKLTPIDFSSIHKANTPSQMECFR